MDLRQCDKADLITVGSACTVVGICTGIVNSSGHKLIKIAYSEVLLPSVVGAGEVLQQIPLSTIVALPLVKTSPLIIAVLSVTFETGFVITGGW